MKKSHSEDWQKPVGPEYAVDEPEFMAEFGRAMAAWGSIEHALSGVYALVLEARQPHYARASFHSVISFRDRLGMVDVAVRLATTCFPGSLWENLEAEWARLRDTASKASFNRMRPSIFLGKYKRFSASYFSINSRDIDQPFGCG